MKPFLIFQLFVLCFSFATQPPVMAKIVTETAIPPKIVINDTSEEDYIKSWVPLFSRPQRKLVWGSVVDMEAISQASENDHGELYVKGAIKLADRVIVFDKRQERIFRVAQSNTATR